MIHSTRTAGFLRFVWVAACLTGCFSATSGAPSTGPGGVSRIFHVECGFYCPPGSPAWSAEYDEAHVADGYGYTVKGRSYHGGGAGSFCWFFTETGRVTIRCPKRLEATLYLNAVDLSNNSRVQTITVSGTYTDRVEKFFEPAGKWLAYRLSADDTAAGTIVIDIVRNAGANAVLSRIDLVPDGLADALVSEKPETSEDAVERDWFRQERLKRRRPSDPAAVAETLERGRLLVADLRELGAGEAARTAAADLKQFERRYQELVAQKNSGKPTRSAIRTLYLEVRRSIRTALFRIPQLDFDTLLFVKRFTPEVGHQCSHHVGSSQRPGSDLCLLEGLRPDGTVRSIIGEQLPVGAIGRPALSHDARTLVFPYARPRPEPTPYP